MDTAAPTVTAITASGLGVTAGDGALNAGKTVTLTLNASEALSVSGYWKRSRTEEGWREDKAEWNRLAELDAAQPAGA